MNPWEIRDIVMLLLILGLGMTCALLGVGWSTNNDRINILSKRIYDLEQIVERRQ